MKKVVIITYYWPPSGGPGVQRVLKFAKYLPQFGWEPIILTVKEGEYPALDESLIAEVADDLKVYKVKSLEFFDLFRKLTGRKKSAKIETYELVKGKAQLSWKESLAQFVRINFLIPDARIGWHIRGYRTSLKIIRAINPDLIFSSSPPHSLQLLAGKLAHKTDTKWVADFRDPWTKSFYDKGLRRWAVSEKINLDLERKTIAKADCVTTVSQGVLELLGAEAAKKQKIISNGYDADDFKWQKVQNKIFTIVYTGHIASVQNPTLFLQAISALKKEAIEVIKLDIYGSVDSEVIQLVQKLQLQDTVTFHGYIPHNEVTKVMTQADMLLLLIPKVNSKGILTGKLFEYLAADNFILGIGDEHGDAAKILGQCQGGIMINYQRNPFEIIKSQWLRWNKNEIHRGNQEAIASFSRKHLTQELASLFDELCH